MVLLSQMMVLSRECDIVVLIIKIRWMFVKNGAL